MFVRIIFKMISVGTSLAFFRQCGGELIFLTVFFGRLSFSVNLAISYTQAVPRINFSR